jgi:outer membrane protein assembly factor BamD
MRQTVFIWLVACGLCISCASTKPTAKSRSSKVRAVYIDGMRDLLGGRYSESLHSFNVVSRSPGYVKYAALARLRIGDALLLQQKYDAAVEIYRSFLKQYEGNSNVPYARFRIGQAFYAQIAGEWFLSPPGFEREQVPVRRAKRALKKFVRLYPSHPLVSQARKLLNDCDRRLYDHEMYVVDFYESRKKPRAIVQRLEVVFQTYPARAATEENVLLLARSYARIRAFYKAAYMYQAYLKRYPKGSYRAQAVKSLKLLQTEHKKSSSKSKGS